MGDKLLLRLNICGKPIANKYCEGKMKSTLKRGSKDLKSLGRKRLKLILRGALRRQPRPPSRAKLRGKMESHGARGGCGTGALAFPSRAGRVPSGLRGLPGYPSARVSTAGKTPFTVLFFKCPGHLETGPCSVHFPTEETS